MLIIKTIKFDRSKWNKKQAQQYIDEKNFRPIKSVRVTDKYLIYTLSTNIKGAKYKTKEINWGVKHVFTHI
jgi:hypothetical protein